MSPYIAIVAILVVGLFAVLSVLPLFATQEDEALVQLHE